jgi:hypothetical protein
MNKSTLIKKEPLPNNFKLTFKSLENVYFLFLHKSKREIYEQLELNQEYFYTWKKGKKNYCFINPYSIKKDTKNTEQLIKTQEQITPQKNFFTQQLIKDLKLKDLTKEEFLVKMEYLKNKFKRISQSDNLKFTFEWIKEFLTTLYLKHNKLEKEIIKHNYTEQEQKEQEFLAEIGAMFLQDWIYYQDKRENKYKLLLDSSEDK